MFCPWLLWGPDTCCYLRAAGKRAGWQRAWLCSSDQWHIWELSGAWGMVGSGDELFFLRMVVKVKKTPQMMATPRKRMTVRMRRMKKLMKIFAVSWLMFFKEGMHWYVLIAYLDTDTRRSGVVKKITRTPHSVWAYAVKTLAVIFTWHLMQEVRSFKGSRSYFPLFIIRVSWALLLPQSSPIACFPICSQWDGCELKLWDAVM